MSIPSEVSLIFDDYHIDSLYHVCRFCFNRLSSKAMPKESRRQPLTQLVIDRALKQYQIDFRFEISDLKKPKVLCSGCRTRLANLETGKMTGEKWNKDRPDIEILPMIEDQYHTRGTVGCRPENRCHVCQINASSLNNFLVKLKCYGSRPGRPLLQSPCKPMCSKCRSSNTNTIDDNQEVNIEIESDDLDIERIELHNWLTDSDNSDQSDCD